MSKEEKSTKMKELLFAPNNSNYIEFLQAILLKHGLEIHEVTEKKHFPLKYIPPKAKGYVFHDGSNDTNFPLDNVWPMQLTLIMSLITRRW